MASTKFGRLVAKLSRRRGRGRVRNPRGLAAAIGRRKYGAEGFARKAAAGRRRAAARRRRRRRGGRR